MSLTKLSLDGNTVIKFLPARESLVSDVPDGDGKTANLSLQCVHRNIANSSINSQEKYWLKTRFFELQDLYTKGTIFCKSYVLGADHI